MARPRKTAAAQNGSGPAPQAGAPVIGVPPVQLSQEFVAAFATNLGQTAANLGQLAQDLVAAVAPPPPPEPEAPLDPEVPSVAEPVLSAEDEELLRRIRIASGALVTALVRAGDKAIDPRPGEYVGTVERFTWLQEQIIWLLAEYARKPAPAESAAAAALDA